MWLHISRQFWICQRLLLSVVWGFKLKFLGFNSCFWHDNTLLTCLMRLGMVIHTLEAHKIGLRLHKSCAAYMDCFLQVLLVALFCACFGPFLWVHSLCLDFFWCLIWLALKVLWVWIHLTSLRTPKTNVVQGCNTAAPMFVWLVLGPIWLLFFGMFLACFIAYFHIFRSP